MRDLWEEELDYWYPGRAAWDFRRPFCWWGYHWSPPMPLSVVQLIQAGSLDVPLAALLWLMLERRASLVIAAEPPLAGKSTVLTALLDFLPPGTDRIYLRGLAEPFDFVGQVEPAGSYLLCNEISPDLPTYLWGSKVRRLFELMKEGYPMTSTMHADSPQQVVGLLEGPLRVPRSLLVCLNLVIVLEVSWTRERMVRRVRSLHLLKGDGADGLGLVLLSGWNPAAGVFQHTWEEGLAYLEGRGLARRRARSELRRRARFLEGLVKNGVSSIPDVRRAIAGYSPG